MPRLSPLERGGGGLPSESAPFTTGRHAMHTLPKTGIDCVMPPPHYPMGRQKEVKGLEKNDKTRCHGCKVWHASGGLDTLVLKLGRGKGGGKNFQAAQLQQRTIQGLA